MGATLTPLTTVALLFSTCFISFYSLNAFASLSLKLAGCGRPATTISSIQGSGETSPLEGKKVTIEATVSAKFDGPNQLKGLFVQEEPKDSDHNPNTSEGLFVYFKQKHPPITEIHDQLRITGTVKEHKGRTELTDIKRLVRCKQRAPAILPTPISRPASSHQPSPASHSVSNEFAKLAETTRWEAYEGMLVQFRQPLTIISNRHFERYGELTLSPFGRLINPTQRAPNPPVISNKLDESQHLKNILLQFDDGSTQLWPKNHFRWLKFRHQQPSSRASVATRIIGKRTKENLPLIRGDKINQVTGILDFSYHYYRIHPTQPADIIQEPTHLPSRKKLQHTLRIAAVNANNFFNGHPEKRLFVSRRGSKSWEEYLLKRTLLVDTLKLLNADIIALTEIENDGYGPNSSLADLTEQLSIASKRSYTFSHTASDRIGRDEIRNALLYDAELLEPMGIASLVDSAAFKQKNRPALVQTFNIRYNFREISVVVNHLKSKGGCPQKDSLDQDQLDGESCWSHTRRKATQSLVDWLSQQGLTPTEHRVVLLGDFNAYYHESPLAVLTNHGYHNSVKPEASGDYFTYNYRHYSGQLDHIFLSQFLAKTTRHQTHIWNGFSDLYAAFQHTRSTTSRTTSKPNSHRSNNNSTPDSSLKPFKPLSVKPLSVSELKRVLLDHDPIYIDIQL